MGDGGIAPGGVVLRRLTGEGRTGDGEIVPGGVVVCTFSFLLNSLSSFWGKGGLSFALFFSIEYDSYIPAGLRLDLPPAGDRALFHQVVIHKFGARQLLAVDSSRE